MTSKPCDPGTVGAEPGPEKQNFAKVGAAENFDTIPPEVRQALTAAASAALPVGELEIQALGGKSAWNTRTRPGRIEARVKAVRSLVRAAELVLEAAPELDPCDVVAALRSLALRPSDLLIDALTGQWLAPAAAVRHRGCELVRAVEELARVVHSVKGGATP